MRPVRRVGYGLSAKPDHALHLGAAGRRGRRPAWPSWVSTGWHSSPTTSATRVGGELLARRAEGSWAVDVTRRVLTNGSIYIEQAHLTDGQQLLLSLPDEKLATGRTGHRRIASPAACGRPTAHSPRFPRRLSGRSPAGHGGADHA